MFWKWITYDVDLSKRRNKILTVLSIIVVATLAWIFLLPVISPCGTWICTDAKKQSTDFVVIHENVFIGYTVIILSRETENIRAEVRSNIISAWEWRIRTLGNYSNVEPVEATKVYGLNTES